ncbi:MAG: carboxypeptidase-like regulatory domain-containing protein [Ilumatobacteraceae bacterium]
MEGKLHRKVVALALLMFGLLVHEAGLSLASASDPSVVLETGGQAASNISPSDVITAKSTSPVSASGTVPVEIVSTWDNSVGTISSSSDVVAPEGWTVTYTTDGSTWGALPGSASTVTGVKAAGSVESEGYSAPTQSSPLGLQSVTTSAVGVVRPSLGSFQGGSAGDGWDVSHGLGNIYNVYHHQNYLGIDCHIRASSGTKCWPSLNGAAYTVASHSSAAHSASYVDEAGERLWIVTVKPEASAPHPVGFFCLDISSNGPRPCPSIGVGGFVQLGTVQYNGNDGSFSSGKGEVLGDLISYNGKLYTKSNDTNSPVLCLEVSQAAGCSGQPFYGVADPNDYESPQGSWSLNKTKRFGSRMYITANQRFFDCFDLSTSLRCTGGSWPVTTSAATFTGPLFAVTSNAGESIDKICMHSGAGGTCFTTDGDAATSVTNLPATSSSAWDGWGDNFNHLALDRYYYTNGPNSFGCFDFNTSAACSGYSQGSILANYVYAVAVDPYDVYCLWSNADSGANKIIPFNALTGAVGCAPANPTIDFTADNLISRLPCSSSSTSRGWSTLQVYPSGVLVAADARLTVLRNGQLNQPVSGWSSVAPTAQGVWDLSTLTVADTGSSPTFAISWSSGTLTGTSASLQYTSDPAQLCVDLTVQSVCPSGNGQNTSSTVPGTPLAVNSVVTVSATSTTATSTASAAPISTCLGTLSGTLLETGTSNPVAGAEVVIFDASGSTRIATTSASNGTYSIPRMFPGTYVVTFGPVGNLAPQTPAGTAVISANATTTKNGTYGSSFLNAPMIEKTVYPDSAADFSLAPSGGSGSVSTSATALIDPSNGQGVSQVSGGGLPTWSVTTGTSIRSSGSSTVGTYYAVYKVETSGGSVAHGWLKLNVVSRPGAAPVIPAPTTTPTTSTPPSTPPTSTPTPVTAAPGLLPELTPGGFQATENGQPVGVTVREIERGHWQMVGRDFAWTMQIPAADTPGSAEGVVTLIRNREVNLGGYGFQGNSYVDVWMMPGAGSRLETQSLELSSNVPLRYLGAVLVKADGTFVAPLPVPANVEPGPYTLQANGKSFDGVMRSLNLGVRVLDSPMTLPVTGWASPRATDVAWGLLVAGLCVVYIARRRRV